MPAAWSLCVYCGSSSGDTPAFEACARETGRLLALSNGRLVYGGGRVGLMGTVADAALAHGAAVVGVIPDRILRMEVGHSDLTALHVVQTMHERKQLMAEQSDAFLALPGGIGTMEELFEMWSWQQLGFHDKPVGLLNVDGYYDDLIQFLATCRDRGFVSPPRHDALMVDTDLSQLMERLRAAARPQLRSPDYRQT